MSTKVLGRLTIWALLAALAAAAPATAQTGGSIIQNITASTDRVDLYVNTSKLLRLQKPIPKAMVQNPEIVDLVPRGESELQLLGKKEGFTSVTLWDNQNKTYSIDVLVVKDGRELSVRLKQALPTAALNVQPFQNKVYVTGSVNDPADVPIIEAIAKDYYPEVINKVSVPNVQQVLLHVKVMEVSRTKLRRLGFDWAYLNTNAPVQSVSGLLAAAGVTTTLATSGSETFKFGLMHDGSPFFGVLEALRRNDLAKVLAEPNLVTVSGRPAFFNSGGEFPILVPQSLGTVSVEYKKFGTQVDFLPIVMRDGHIRLEVRPRVSEIDATRSVTIGALTVPGLRTREVDTAVDLRAGQTLAIAGLVQTRLESQTRGFPWLMDLPYLGVPFRRTASEENEIELLIMVTPELVHGMEQCEVPPGGPGLGTQAPSDCEMAFHGYIEVPKCCGPNCGAVLERGLIGSQPIEEEVVPTPAGTVPPGSAPAVTAPMGVPAPVRPTAPTPPQAIQRRYVPGPTAIAPGASPPAQPVTAAGAQVPTAPRNAARPIRQSPYNLTTPNQSGTVPTGFASPGLIGPQGYDVRN